MKKITTLVVAAILCMHLNTAFSQNKILSPVSGTIRNTAGEPLSGASVTNTRTGKGTVTNASGAFTLQGVQENDRLRISYIGYALLLVTVTGNQPLQITLRDASNELDKVVVQAYGVTSDRLRTGNIGRITADDIAKQPVMNILDALQGQIPGVAVTRNNGYASGTIKVEIRGRNTINPNITSEPLYIIDGVPLTIQDLVGADDYRTGAKGAIQSGIYSPALGQSALLGINPNDIESIEVLKDADATAIYGSRAANGVILITTKKGKAGKAVAEGSFSTGVSAVGRFYPVLNTAQYLEMRREALLNDGLPVTVQRAPDLLQWDTTGYTDWQKLLWGGTGSFTDAGATVSGGTRNYSFRLGGNYHAQTDILAAQGMNRRGGMSLNLNYRSVNNRLGINLAGNYSGTFINTTFNPSAVSLPPHAPGIYDEQGKLNYAGWGSLSYLFPFGYLLQEYTSQTNFLNAGLMTGYEITKGLNARISLGFDNIQTTQNDKIPIASQDPGRNPTGSATMGYTFVRNILAEPQLEYTMFIDKGRLNILLGGSYQVNNTTSSSLFAGNITNDLLLNSPSSAGRQTISSFGAEYKYLAAFSRVNYQLMERYIINLNIRRDGSSRFGPGRQFGNFGSAGGAWIFGSEKWAQRLKFLSFGKLRGSYGLTGGDQIPNYQYQSSWTFGRFPYDVLPTLYSGRHYDSTIQWQVNKKLELGLALGLLNNRIFLEASWYRNRCDNQLVSFPTPAYTGFVSVISNSPANVQNTGWEFMLKTFPVKSASFIWESKFHIGINRNKLLSYPNLEQSPYAAIYAVGESLNILRLLHFTGVDAQTGKYTFEDRNQNGKTDVDKSMQTTDDRYIFDRSDKYSGGFSNTVTYKNWSLDFLFFFKKQYGLKPFIDLGGIPGAIKNQSAEVLRRWRQPGDVTDIAKYTTSPDVTYTNFTNNSDGAYTDASYIRLQNVQLAYAFNQNRIKRIGLNSCRLYIRGQNLLLLTKYKGADPEIQNPNTISIPRIITAGLFLTF